MTEFNDMNPEPDAGGQAPRPESVDYQHAPDVGESLRQMEARLGEISDRLPASEEGGAEADGLEYGVPEYDDEELAAYAEQSGLLDQGDDADDLEEVEDLISERVDQAVRPIAAQFEYNRRVEAIHALADKYPAQLKDEAALERIAMEAEQLAAAYNRPDLETDPAVLERLVLADAAMTGHAAETPAEGGNQGATLESGAGPSAAGEPEIDPATRSYLNAIAGSDKPNAFTR
jgi:hypothetical protein